MTRPRIKTSTALVSLVDMQPTGRTKLLSEQSELIERMRVNCVLAAAGAGF